MELHANPLGRWYRYIRDWVIMVADRSVCAMRSCRDRDTDAWDIFMDTNKFHGSLVLDWNFVSLLIILHISTCISAFASFQKKEQIFSSVMTTNCLLHERSELIWPHADGGNEHPDGYTGKSCIITYQMPPAMSVLPALVRLSKALPWRLWQAEGRTVEAAVAG
jgi:hypothetical protein